ncbi:MAG: hypothetical protein A2W91_10320 [Bacteroidetes bacterium GWF2_38_335]|nr:MAG: hypothetical protein A2W91_10320 [Bacteroidetes bacterium GWF2_38_335]OFY81900.1 MAG: hypothetical protein A2281_06720 [Bacteroidetes bacterium RIFOXYA12_FULL_38_20]HBS87980.1 hypothetical protein [Bacteroidales bacterium]
MYENYYRILELRETASKEEIKRAYRRLAKKYHPDISDDPDAQNKFISICEAYEVLIESKKPLWQKNKHDLEETLRKAKERAAQRAKVKQEKIQKDLEEFKKSGLYDIVLILKYFLHFIILIAAPVCLLIPFYLGFTIDYKVGLALIFVFIFGIIISVYIYSRGEKYFRLGKFYYTRKTIITRLKLKNIHSSFECFYCKGKNANSKFYKITLLKVMNIELETGGVFSHSVRYRRKYKTLEIPRSRKAFIVHLINSLLKVLSIVLCMIFLQIDSLLWRFILGVFAGVFLSLMMSFISQTRPRTSYLFTRGLLLKILIWINLIMYFTTITNDFNFQVSRFVPVLITLLIFFDAVLDAIFDGIPNNFSQKPFLVQPESVNNLKENGYRGYLSAPILSVVFPFFKWLFG